ncbi:MAG TPA: Glu/Leu/Phe/Val dehydrogenase [Pyrinomonadaceae bacterium]|nr:Glu/Leu/Phe/Val dehydrogenase [Pyrinomonadaceae bacterium]
MNIKNLPINSHEHLSSCTDENGYHGLIAIHSTRLGPAIGGTRFWQYRDEAEAIEDVLRLARGMTYKNALAGLPLGGGKSIILKNEHRNDRETIFRTHGRFVDTFAGRYITAEDVGTSPAEMEYIRKETQHVAGLMSGSGDPSPVTARGVFRALQAAAKYRWGSEALAQRTIALQGCGNVGYHLSSHLHAAGARLIVSDIDPNKAGRVVNEFGATAVTPEEIYQVDADVFAPCGLGGVLNDETIPQLKTEIVTGAANNQLLEPKHGDDLEARGILYTPDYAANSGGVINGCRELLGWDSAQSAKKVDEIYDTILNLFQLAAAEGIPTYKAADRLAEQRLDHG